MKERGLPSLGQSRDLRRRAVVHGRVRMRDAMPQFWLWTMVGMLAFGVIYWWWSANDLEKQKASVMARQRAFAVKLEPRLVPLRDRVEQWAIELSEPWSSNSISPKLNLERLAASPGAYLRLLLEDARDVSRLRTAADRSLHDGFTSCLFVREAHLDGEGTRSCNTSSDCEPGEICNEFERCAPPTQPYNLRLMYRALRVLSPAWTDELHQATSDYGVRVFNRDLDAVAKIDVPVALELSSRARYFTLLLDEKPEAGLPHVDGLGKPDGLVESEMEQLQAVPHTVRLGVWDLESGEALARLRTGAGASFVPLGAAASAPFASRRAAMRQVNNCSIAGALRDAASARSEGPGMSPGSPGAPGTSSTGATVAAETGGAVAPGTSPSALAPSPSGALPAAPGSAAAPSAARP